MGFMSVPIFSAYSGLPFWGQMLHGVHFVLCSFALLAACIPLLTEKGSVEHKFGGIVYLPISMLAMALSTYLAWQESSLVLFSFNAFCFYLLLSGWRAAHSQTAPQLIDWFIPAALFTLAVIVSIDSCLHDRGPRTMYLMFFAVNAFYLSWRDYQYLKGRTRFEKYKIFVGSLGHDYAKPGAWLARHIAGMVGSVIANLSVIVLTLLPLSLHWLWPVTLLLAGAYIAAKEHEKKLRARRAIATVLQPRFRATPAKPVDDVRRAA